MSLILSNTGAASATDDGVRQFTLVAGRVDQFLEGYIRASAVGTITPDILIGALDKQIHSIRSTGNTTLVTLWLFSIAQDFAGQLGRPYWTSLLIEGDFLDGSTSALFIQSEMQFFRDNASFAEWDIQLVPPSGVQKRFIVGNSYDCTYTLPT